MVTPTASTVVIHEVAGGKKVGYGPAEEKLNQLARQGYRIVSVFPQGDKYVIVGQREGWTLDPEETVIMPAHQACSIGVLFDSVSDSPRPAGQEPALPSKTPRRAKPAR